MLLFFAGTIGVNIRNTKVNSFGIAVLGKRSGIRNPGEDAGVWGECLPVTIVFVDSVRA